MTLFLTFQIAKSLSYNATGSTWYQKHVQECCKTCYCLDKQTIAYWSWNLYLVFASKLAVTIRAFFLDDWDKPMLAECSFLRRGACGIGKPRNDVLNEHKVRKQFIKV